MNASSSKVMCLRRLILLPPISILLWTNGCQNEPQFRKRTDAVNAPCLPRISIADNPLYLHSNTRIEAIPLRSFDLFVFHRLYNSGGLPLGFLGVLGGASEGAWKKSGVWVSLS
jgi:hypothetical protein